MAIAVVTVLLFVLMFPAAIHILLQLVGGWCDA